jgi:hypothetical protein
MLSCAASLPPNFSIRSQYFSITTPGEEDWNEIEDNNLENDEIIWLQKGHGPGNLSEAEHPIKTLFIQRRTIQDNIDNTVMLNATLYDNLQSDIKIFVDDLSERFYLDDFQSHPVKSKDKLFYNFTYDVSFPFDSLDPNTPPSPNIDKEKIPLGKGIGQYYIYFPKFYKEWSCYYLFIYDEYPLDYSSENNISISEKAEITKDSINSSSEIDTEIKFELTNFIKGFSCVEDSLIK